MQRCSVMQRCRSTEICGDLHTPAGANDVGQVGVPSPCEYDNEPVGCDSSSSEFYSEPVAVAGDHVFAAIASTQGDFSCALKSTGATLCWVSHLHAVARRLICCFMCLDLRLTVSRD